MAAAVALAMFQSAALAQTTPLPPPAIGDLAAVTRCLTGKGCAQRPAGIESVPLSVCAADETLKAGPNLLRAEIRAFAKSEPAARCDAAQKAMMPLRDQLRDAYESAKPASLASKFVGAATDYVNACFTRGLPKFGVAVALNTSNRPCFDRSRDA